MTNIENVGNLKFQILWRKLNRNQRRFVVQLPEYSSKKDCAEAIGMHPMTVYAWPKYVNEAAELYQEHIADAAAAMLVDGIGKAALVKLGGLDSEDERIQQMSATELLDRYYGKAKQKTELSTEDDKPIRVEFVNDWRD